MQVTIISIINHFCTLCTFHPLFILCLSLGNVFTIHRLSLEITGEFCHLKLRVTFSLSMLGQILAVLSAELVSPTLLLAHHRPSAQFIIQSIGQFPSASTTKSPSTATWSCGWPTCPQISAHAKRNPTVTKGG